MLIDRFQTMIRNRTEAEFDLWIIEARASLIASFATGITSDKAAVRAAITEPWSNGQTEGQITKLKLVRSSANAGETMNSVAAARPISFNDFMIVSLR